ncbi:hypothetical protein SAMN05192559_11118 [Halobacillus karajensis]|uniref:Uncharacterized protein n=1 Tax=Halobacillus karajensis TaxID=195088 RepID=A0A024P8Q3_9BACI|nr:hypothetical protein [Halobacillus karajensis]CDQ21579.1 hypothetical protein BN982_03982 [Halobacillus karajensis]CDQ25514.1 hypothetical protein BN983_03861 [Halobacillus karajensis]CDQ28956.1 hypothetical protein BN981_03299 [Halobacillus karajensis]SEI08789.1 hypothetical protein SAMN05192559_11118 [Halobacillus karajensis]
MKKRKPRRGNVKQTNEMAQVFNRKLHYNQAFSHQTDNAEVHSESEALYHHYADDED